MSSAATICPGRDADAAGFIALIGACWAEYPACVMAVDAEVPELRALASYYAAKGGALWCAKRAGVVVGMVAVRPLGARVVELCKLYVAASERGSGLAAELLAGAENWARARGAAEMLLWSDTRFARAHRFYEKHSFVRSGPIRALHDLSHTVEFGYAKPLLGAVVRTLDTAAAAAAERRLAAVLRACGEEEGGRSLALPLAAASAAGFWRRVTAEVAAGRRLLFAAWWDGVLAGTVQLDLASAFGGGQWAEAQALLVHPALRRRGLGRLLLRQAEAEAAAAGRRLVLLYGGEASAAAALCRSLAWEEYGRFGAAASPAGGS